MQKNRDGWANTLEKDQPSGGQGQVEVYSVKNAR